MHIKSVNIGLPQEIEWKGKKVVTGIFKQPTEQPLQVKQTNIAGDGQADLINHGGIDKAVYAYPYEHYNYWYQLLGVDNLELGSFGENLTTTGITDPKVFLGDYWQFGSAVLMAVQPRFPCYKLGIRFKDERMTKTFLQARRNGIYFRVIEEGILQNGDAIKLIQKSEHPVTIQDVVDNYVLPDKDQVKIEQILSIPFLPNFLREHFTPLSS
ncbi:MOSC domain-containing protein [Adhaeribacter aquaticus]|uniref:MOSC domain-containing protein n=1 Tax=Adhaeribacter aquaticus TaxID=299567 RepID=UPI00041914A5|nr:MOSC domain-containing protein [Adhaeribacter aquaticus]